MSIIRKSFDGGIKGAGGFGVDNYKDFLTAMSGGDDGLIELDSMKIRIGESSLLPKLFGKNVQAEGH